MIDFIRYLNNYDLISDFGRTKGFFKGQLSGVMHLTLEEVESLTSISMSRRFQDIDTDNSGTVTRNNCLQKPFLVIWADNPGLNILEIHSCLQQLLKDL